MLSSGDLTTNGRRMVHEKYRTAATRATCGSSSINAIMDDPLSRMEEEGLLR